MKKYALGMDIGGSRTKTGLVDIEKGTIVKSVVYPTQKEEAAFFRGVAEQTKECAASVADEEIIGIGISASGFVHNPAGIMDPAASSFIPFFPDYPLTEKISHYLNMPCRAENDATAVCYGEALFGGGRAYKRVLMLTLGTGVGIGFINDRKLTVENELIHRAGHIKVCDLNTDCYCKIPGCLESVCSGTALNQTADKVYGRHVTNEELFEWADNGCKSAQGIIAEYIHRLAVGLNQYIYIFAPDVIILGGGVSSALEGYLKQIKALLSARVYTGYKTDVIVSELKENAGILGGAALWFHNWKHQT